MDVRGNGGGNVSQMLIERLGRKPLGTGFGRNSEVPDTYPGTAFYGHMACLLDEDSASDGDIFPFYFREAGLGPLIGKRTWGGVVGIAGRGPLIDGGTIYVPEFSTNDMHGNWIIEGIGRGAGHRGRERPEVDSRGPRSSARAGRRRGDEEHASPIRECCRLDRSLPSRPSRRKHREVSKGADVWPPSSCSQGRTSGTSQSGFHWRQMARRSTEARVPR